MLPLSTTDASCGTLHFTLTVLINSSSSKGLDYIEKFGGNRQDKFQRSSVKPTEQIKDQIITTYKCMEQMPVSVPSLSTSLNTPLLPESFTTQYNTTQSSGSSALNNPIMMADIPFTKKPTGSKFTFKPQTPLNSCAKNYTEKEFRLNMGLCNVTGGKLCRARRLSSTEASTDSYKWKDGIQHNRMSLRNNNTNTKDNSRDTSPSKDVLKRKGLSKTCFPIDISAYQCAKMSTPYIPLSTYKISNKKASNTKVTCKKSNTKQLPNSEPICKTEKIKKHDTENTATNQLILISNKVPSQQPVPQRISYVLSFSSAASLQASPNKNLGPCRPFRTPAMNGKDRNATLVSAVKRTGSDNNLNSGDSSERHQTPSPNKRANISTVTAISSNKAVEIIPNEVSNKQIKEKFQVGKSSIVSPSTQTDNSKNLEFTFLENNETRFEVTDECSTADQNLTKCEDSLHVESASTYTQTQYPAVPSLPTRGNLRLHPAVLRKNSQQAQCKQPKTSFATIDKNKVLYRQSFPTGKRETNINLATETANIFTAKQLSKQDAVAQITVVSVTGESNNVGTTDDTKQASSVSGLLNSSNRPPRNHSLHRQCAVQSCLSIDTEGVTTEMTSSNSNTIQLQNTFSIESVEGQASHVLYRRPRSLINQSAGSLQSFGLFGSVDSEQSVPRTAPLATPEQELSLLEMSSFENLPLDSVLHQGCVMLFGANNRVNNEVEGALPGAKKEIEHQHSLDSISNDIFLHQMCTTPSRLSTASVLNEAQTSKNDNHQSSLLDHNTKVEKNIVKTQEGGFDVDFKIKGNINKINDDAACALTNNIKNVTKGRSKRSLSNSSSDLLTLLCCKSDVCDNVSVCSKSSENISTFDMKKRIHSNSKFIKYSKLENREVIKTHETDSQLGTILACDVNFMDLSCSSSNHGSPQSQIMETDMGILSSNHLGLNSPTIVKGREESSSNNNNNLSPSVLFLC